MFLTHPQTSGMSNDHHSILTLDAASDPASIGRRRFIVGALAGAAATATASAISEGVASAADLPAGASNFHILPAAVRLVDTRSASKYVFTRIASNHIRVKVGGANGVPSTAKAAVLTVTAVNFSDRSHVTVYPTGEALPEASNLNLLAGAVSANLVTVKLGSNGSVDVRSFLPCHLVVDVLGYYRPVTAAVREGRYISLSAPRRVLDTRPTKVANESYTTVDVTASVPPDASAVVINLTAAACTARGHFTAMPYTVAGPPSTSSLNATGPGDTRAVGAVVPVTTIGGRRRIKIYAHRSAFIIVDVFGYFTGTGSSLSQVGLFVPVTPRRLKDTRGPGEIGRMWPGWVVEVPLPADIDSKAGAIVANVTGVNSRGPGHLTVSAARQVIPGTSNVNWTTAGATVPNHVTTAVTNAYGFQVFNAFGGHVVVDLAGYYTGTPKVPALPKYQNPPPPAAPPNWVIRVPRIGLTSTVIAGDPTAITDAGHSWHWTGTGYLGQAAHVAVFAHRTEHGGPYRYVHELEIGDVITVTTSDAREYTYRMVRRDLTDAATANILAATRAHPGTTFSMIACTRPDFLPTSLSFRIVVTFELVSWREI